LKFNITRICGRGEFVATDWFQRLVAAQSAENWLVAPASRRRFFVVKFQLQKGLRTAGKMPALPSLDCAVVD
jgi:hypothetical protein